MNTFAKAFTLIELLIVIAIIAILASILFVTIGQTPLQKTRDAKRLADIDQIQLALNLYAQDNNGSFPSSGGNWRCLGHSSATPCWTTSYTGLDSLNNALSPYMSKIPDDPRNHNHNPSTCYGDAYLYSSNQGNIYGGAGTYLHWYYETGPDSNQSCGKGIYGGRNGCGPYCWLYIGSPTP